MDIWWYYMGKKQLVINLLSNMISYGSSIFISLILAPYLIKVLGKETYSFYPIANNFVQYMAVFTSGINIMASRFITIQLISKNQENANKYFSSILYANIVISFILVIPMMIIVLFLERILNVPIDSLLSIKLLFAFVFISMLINVITSVFGVATFAKNRLDLRSYSDIFEGILRIALFIILFSLFSPSIYFVGLVAFILCIMRAIIQYLFTRRLIPEIAISKKFLDFGYIKTVMMAGFWNSLNSLGNTLLVGTTLIIANILLGAEKSANLSIVQTAIGLINGVITMLVGVFVPRITHKYVEGNKSDLVNEVTFSQKIIGLITNVPIVLIIVFGRDFYSLWVPSIDADTLQILSIVSLIPLLIIANMWTIYNLNTVLNRVRIPSLMLISVGIFNIGITIFGVKILNGELLYMLIINSSLSIIYHLIFIPIYSCKCLSIKLFTFYPQIFRSLFGSVICFTVLYTMKSAFFITSWMKLIIAVLICGFIGLTINVIFVLGKKDIALLKEFINKKFIAK